jgi:hypothetical protein
MENIINDQFHDKTVQFIQQHINDSYLSDELKQKFVEFYQQVNRNNSETIYRTVKNLYSQEVTANRQAFNTTMLQYAGGTMLVGGGIHLIGSMGERYSTARTARTFTNIRNIGSVIMGLGFIGLLSIGH